MSCALFAGLEGVALGLAIAAEGLVGVFGDFGVFGAVVFAVEDLIAAGFLRAGFFAGAFLSVSSVATRLAAVLREAVFFAGVVAALAALVLAFA